MSTNILLPDQVELDRKARAERERLEDIMTALNPDWIEDFEGNLDLAVTAYRTRSPVEWAEAESKVNGSWRDVRDFAIFGGIVAATLVVLVVWVPLAWTLRLIHGR